MGDVERDLENLKGGVKEEVQMMCDALLVRLSELDGDVSQAAYYLPPFDVRQSRISIATLRKKVLCSFALI